MKNKIRMGFAAAFTVFTLSIMPVQAGGETPPIKGGIADLRYIKTTMTVNVSASNNTTARNADEGSATTGDTTTGTTSGEVSTAGIATCDFSGFAQNDVLNNAYAGGASLTGVVKPNIQIGYFDARVLNTYFGANETNPGIAYTNTGSILVSLQNIAGTNFAFSYTCAVKLTVRTFSSVDGSGTALNTYTLAKNLPGTMGPYNVWTNFSQPINATVRSISISGDAARWGMDQVVVQVVSSELMVPSQYPTIQAAVNAAVNGNKVIVAPGVYPESVNLLGKQIRVESSTSRAAIVRAPQNTRSFVMTTGETNATQIVGFRLEKSGTAGGGISTSSSSPNLENCLFFECTNATGGGALIQGGSPILESCDFTSCDANGKLDSSTYGSGGAIRSIGGSVKINHCIFRNCVGPYNANILMLENGGSSLISHCTFSGNNTNSTSNIYNAYSTVTITDSVFESFSSGTVLFGWAPFTVDRCQFKNITGSNVMVMRFGQNILRDCSFEDCMTSGYLFGVTYSGTYSLKNCNFCRVSSPYFQGGWSDLGGNNFNACPAPATLTLTTNAAACNRVGSAINVDATLSGVVSPIVAGQVYITWNASKMTLDSISAGDTPFIEFHVINQTAGTALILVSLEQGGSAVSVLSKIIARMHFTVVGGSCDGSGTDIQFFPDGTLPTEFTDGVGGTMVPALVASSGFKVDDGAPVLINVPANVPVQAEAGMGNFANVALTPPTATDACAPGLTVSSSRNDGQPLSAAFLVGTTTVTWSATDPCANTTTATTRVTVNNANTATFAVSYTNSGSYAASSARLLTLNIHGDYVYTLKASQPITLVNGAGTISLTDLAVDNYACVAIEEKGRSLRRVAIMSDAGLIWTSTATLVAGDLINDEVVDVLDWGAYIVGNPNADLDGNGAINANDGNIIITNFGQKGETGCGTSFMSPPEPLSGISVAELVDRGLTDLVSADLNNDGWLDMEDVRISGN